MCHFFFECLNIADADDYSATGGTWAQQKERIQQMHWDKWARQIGKEKQGAGSAACYMICKEGIVTPSSAVSHQEYTDLAQEQKSSTDYSIEVEKFTELDEPSAHKFLARIVDRVRKLPQTSALEELKET